MITRSISRRTWTQILLIGILAGCTPAARTPTHSSLSTPTLPPPVATQGMDLPAIPATATTRTLLPTPVPGTPDPTRLTALSPAGQIVLQNQKLSAVAIDEQSVYWVDSDHPQQIERARLSAATNPTPEMVVKSRYVTGNLSAMPIQVQNGWIVFLDQAFNATNPLWRLRAFNLQTRQEKILDQAGGNYLARIYGFSSDGDQVAWIKQDQDPRRACTEESVIVVANLVDGKTTQLIRSCALNDRQWNSVQISNSRVIASATAIEDTSLASIYYWPTLQSDPVDLSQSFAADQPSTPAMGGDWAAWQSSPGQIRLVHLGDLQNRVLTSPLEGGQLAGPVFSGSILTWLPTPDVLIYRPDTASWEAVASPSSGVRISQASAGSGRIAWVRQSTIDSDPSSIIEWAMLP